MSDLDQDYHRLRVRQCREMAEQARDPDVRRRHEELAELHAGRLGNGEVVESLIARPTPA
jgi:hypothetical protein